MTVAGSEPQRWTVRRNGSFAAMMTASGPLCGDVGSTRSPWGWTGLWPAGASRGLDLKPGGALGDSACSPGAPSLPDERA